MPTDHDRHSRIGYLAACLLAAAALLLPVSASAASYANAAEPFAWVDPASHTTVVWTGAPGGPAAECSGGSAATDDDITQELALGFTFNFGGTNYTTVRVMSNGRLQFNNTFCGAGTQNPIPRTYTYGYPDGNVVRTLRVYGADLDPSVAGTGTTCPAATCHIRYATLGSAPNRRFVVTWTNVPEWSAAGSFFNLQVIIEEGGDFIYQFGASNNPSGGTAQIGWELTTGDYDLVAFASIGALANSAVRFRLPSPTIEYRYEQTSFAGGVTNTGSGGATYNGTVLNTSGTGVSSLAAGRVCRRATVPNNGLGETDALDTGADVDTALGSSGTITFWYRSALAWNSGGSTDRTLLDATSGAAGPDGNRKFFWLVLQSNGRLRFELENASDANFSATVGAGGLGTGTAAGTWVHVAIAWNLAAGRMTIYVNGAQAAQRTGGAISLANFNTLYIGDNRLDINDNPNRGNSAYGDIDEVRMYSGVEGGAGLVSRDMNFTASCVAVDHYAISYPNGAGGVTCDPLLVRITAHDAAHAVVQPTAGTVMNITTGAGTGVWLSPAVAGSGVWTPSGSNNGAATYTWPGGESALDVRVRHNTALAAFNINVSDGNGKTESAPGEDPNASFADAGFRVTADGTSATSVGTQISGKNSDTGSGAQTLYLQAIRTDTATGSCTALIQSQTVTVDLASQCNSPGTCVPSPGSQVSVRNNVGSMVAIAQNNSAGVSAYTGVPLAFDAQSKAPLVLNYPDAGQLTLYARYALPSPPAATYVTGASNAFVVRPFGFAFRGATAGTAVQHGTTAASAPLAAAGDNFTMTVAAYRWAAGEDADSDGVPDAGADLTDNGLAPNFAWLTGVSATGNLPGVATGGVTRQSTGDGNVAAASFSAGAATVNDWRYSEAGNVFLAAVATDYIVAGVNVYGNSGHDGTAAAGGYVGRFRPKHFRIDTVTAATLANRAALLPCASAFSYMGENMRLSFKLLAQNAQDAVTQNYTGAYAKLDPATTPVFGFGARSGGTNLTSRLGSLYPGLAPAWSSGTLEVTTANPVHIRVGRATPDNPDGPYAAVQFGMAPVDSDGVAMASYDQDVDNSGSNDHAAVAAATVVRFGRLRLANAYGSELLDLPIPTEAQYWNGVGFVRNDVPGSEDNCTTLTGGAAGNINLANWLKNLAAAEMDKSHVAVGNPFAAGRGNVRLTRPTLGDGVYNGSVDLTVDLAAEGKTYLQGAWTAGSTYTQNPTARATFGAYKNANEFIFMRENY